MITSFPGSSLASYKAWENPRWEDYEYESWLPEDNNMSWLGNGYTHAERSMDWTNTTDYMDWEDESTVLLIENPVFTGPKLHEEPYRYAEVNPGVLDANPKIDGAGKTAPSKGEVTAPGTGSGHTATGGKAAETNGGGGVQATGVESGLAPSGTEVTLGEKVNDGAEPELNGHVEVTGSNNPVPVKLVQGEAEVLKSNM